MVVMALFQKLRASLTVRLNSPLVRCALPTIQFAALAAVLQTPHAVQNARGSDWLGVCSYSFVVSAGRMDARQRRSRLWNLSARVHLRTK